MNKNLPETQMKVTGKYIRISPPKIQRVLNQIRGCFYEEALILLDFMPYKACLPIKKILKSAAANFKEKYKIENLNELELKVLFAFVNRGPILKRIRYRAKGRIFGIKKYTSHITLILERKE